MRAITLSMRPTLRSMNRIAPAIIALSVLGIAALIGRGQPPPVPVALRLLAVVIAAGVAGALDDPAESSIAASPVPLRARRALRGLLGLCAAWATWAVTAGVLFARFGAQDVALGRLAVEFAALTAVVMAVASIALRSGQPTGLPAGATAALTFAFLSLHLPRSLALLGAPQGTTAYDAETLRWLLVMVAGVLTLAIGSRDPARTIQRRRRDR